MQWRQEEVARMHQDTRQETRFSLGRSPCKTFSLTTCLCSRGYFEQTVWWSCPCLCKILAGETGDRQTDKMHHYNVINIIIRIDI